MKQAPITAQELHHKIIIGEELASSYGLNNLGEFQIISGEDDFFVVKARFFKDVIKFITGPKIEIVHCAAEKKRNNE